MLIFKQNHRYRKTKSLSSYLLIAFQSKDRGKKTEFYEACYSQLFHQIHFICKRYFPQEAEDMTHNVFLKIMSIPLEKLVHYIYYLEKALIVIAKNYCKTSLIVKKQRRTLEIKENYDYLSENPHLNFDLKFDRMYLMSLLSKRQKLALERTIEGYFQKEIALEMKTSVGAIKNLIFRGRIKIRGFEARQAS